MTIGRWHSKIDKAEQKKIIIFALTVFSLPPLFCFLMPVSQCSLSKDQMCVTGSAPVKTKTVKSVSIALLLPRSLSPIAVIVHCACGN